MPKVVYTAAKGLVQSAGSGVTLESLPSSPVQAITTTSAISSPGAYTISGAGALTITMPLAATHPGGVFSFRTLSAHAHRLTGSDAGASVFSGVNSGARVTLSSTIGSSIVLMSDGKSFCQIGASGTLTYAVPA